MLNATFCYFQQEDFLNIFSFFFSDGPAFSGIPRFQLLS
jgi:hypothetical protein